MTAGGVVSAVLYILGRSTLTFWSPKPTGVMLAGAALSLGEVDTTTALPEGSGCDSVLDSGAENDSGLPLQKWRAAMFKPTMISIATAVASSLCMSGDRISPNPYLTTNQVTTEPTRFVSTVFEVIGFAGYTRVGSLLMRQGAVRCVLRTIYHN